MNLDQPNGWDIARSLRMWRVNPATQAEEKLDAGVNFFVLALEVLGAKPRTSCEGHPDGFVIMFEANDDLVSKLSAIGHFDVTAEQAHESIWSLRLVRCASAGWSEHERVRTLRAAAGAWLKAFPKLVWLDMPVAA